MSSSPKSCSLGKKHGHKFDEQLYRNTIANSKDESFLLWQKENKLMPGLTAESAVQAHYLSPALPEEWYWCSRQGDAVPDVHKPPLSCVIEWHFPLMCLCCFGTQLANWPLIRQAASRAQTVTVERSSFWERPLCSGSPCCISFSPVKAIIVWETYRGSGEASAWIRFGNKPISM